MLRQSGSRVADGVGYIQGVIPATVFLDRDDLETQELGHASLSRLIRPIVDAGAPQQDPYVCLCR